MCGSRGIPFPDGSGRTVRACRLNVATEIGSFGPWNGALNVGSKPGESAIELASNVPSGPVQQQHGVRALGDVAPDFVEVELHHVNVGVGRHEARPDAAGRADGAEQISVVVALVGGLPWLRSAPGHCRTWPFWASSYTSNT
jgi:hypothetical protein